MRTVNIGRGHLQQFLTLLSCGNVMKALYSTLCRATKDPSNPLPFRFFWTSEFADIFVIPVEIQDVLFYLLILGMPKDG